MTQPSQRERIAQYIQDRYAVEPEYLWTRYPNYAVFRQPEVVRHHHGCGPEKP